MTRIHIFGSLNADLLVEVDELPARGETTIGGNFRRLSGGKGGNQAFAAARLAPDGVRVAMAARIGDDEVGAMLREDLAAAGVDVTDVITVPGRPSGIAMITVDKTGANTIVVAPGANAAWEDGEPLHVDVDPGDLVVVQLEIPVRTVRHVVEHAAAQGARVIVNAAPAHPEASGLLPFVDVLIVNEVEAQQLLGIEEPTPEAAARARAHFGGDLVITKGADGVIVAERSGSASQLPAFSIDAVDTVGAGDAFVGAFVAALAAGTDLISAAQFANASGAITAMTAGARDPHLTRLRVDDLMEGR